jgi:hypothetical protein
MKKVSPRKRPISKSVEQREVTQTTYYLVTAFISGADGVPAYANFVVNVHPLQWWRETTNPSRSVTIMNWKTIPKQEYDAMIACEQVRHMNSKYPRFAW